MNSVIVVEGIHDEMKIKSVYPEANIVITNGTTTYYNYNNLVTAGNYTITIYDYAGNSNTINITITIY